LFNIVINKTGIKLQNMDRTKRILIGIGVLGLLSALNKIVSIYSLLLPAVLILISYILFNKFLDRSKKPFFLSYSFILGYILLYCGQTTYLLIMYVGEPPLVIYEIVSLESVIEMAIYLALLMWLIIRPGLVSGIATAIYVLFFTILMAIAIFMSEDQFEQIMLVLNATIYAMTLIILIHGIITYRKNQLDSRNEFTTPASNTVP
jgi:hypothetical protein